VLFLLLLVQAESKQNGVDSVIHINESVSISKKLFIPVQVTVMFPVSIPIMIPPKAIQILLKTILILISFLLF